VSAQWELPESRFRLDLSDADAMMQRIRQREQEKEEQHRRIKAVRVRVICRGLSECCQPPEDAFFENIWSSGARGAGQVYLHSNKDSRDRAGEAASRHAFFDL